MPKSKPPRKPNKKQLQGGVKRYQHDRTLRSIGKMLNTANKLEQLEADIIKKENQ